MRSSENSNHNVTILHQEREITIFRKYKIIGNESKKVCTDWQSRRTATRPTIKGNTKRDSVRMIQYYNENIFKLLHNFQGRKIAAISQRRHKTNQLSTNPMNTMCSQPYGYKTKLPPKNIVSKYLFYNPKYIPTGILTRK